MGHISNTHDLTWFRVCFSFFFVDFKLMTLISSTFLKLNLKKKTKTKTKTIGFYLFKKLEIFVCQRKWKRKRNESKSLIKLYHCCCCSTFLKLNAQADERRKHQIFRSDKIEFEKDDLTCKENNFNV